MISRNNFVSQVEEVLKANNKDNRIPRRLILSVGEDVATFLISQKWGDRTILQENNLYTQINCFEFEKIDSKQCPSIEFRYCKTLMKSKCKVPKLVFSKLGSSIKDIVSLDGEFTFSFIDEIQYRRNKARTQKIEDEVYVYLGSDYHLYIPDREILSIDLTILTLDKDAKNICSSCSEEEDSCKNLWDSEFVCPDKLLEAVKDMTFQRLQITRSIQEDQNPNGIENG